MSLLVLVKPSATSEAHNLALPKLCLLPSSGSPFLLCLLLGFPDVQYHQVAAKSTRWQLAMALSHADQLT